jgi:cytidylate kinase
MAWRNAFSPDARIVLICGEPGTGKTDMGKKLAQLLPGDWKFYSLGNELREAHKRSGSKLPFEVWVAKIRPRKLRRIHKKFVRKLRKMNHIIVDMRYPEFFGKAPWLLTIYFDGDVQKRAEWSAEHETKYGDATPDEIADILTSRGADERRAWMGMRLYHHDTYPYDIKIDSPSCTENELLGKVLAALSIKNRDLALARSPRFFKGHFFADTPPVLTCLMMRKVSAW